jgi:hypothetical protein
MDMIARRISVVVAARAELSPVPFKQELLEYAAIGSLVALVCLVTLTDIGVTLATRMIGL